MAQSSPPCPSSSFVICLKVASSHEVQRARDDLEKHKEMVNKMIEELTS